MKQVNYIYLDAAGIESLLAQTTEWLETERSTAVESTGTGRVGVTGRLKSFILKAVGGPELEVDAEIGASQKNIQQGKQLQAPEQKLAIVISGLEKIGKPILFSDLVEASRAADGSGESVFVNVREQFNAPQFQPHRGIGAVNQDGYLLLELGTAGAYRYGDDYYKKPNRVVTLSANISKMPTSARGMSGTGHDAVFFRGFNGRDVPLGVFGILTATPNYYQIKPYAIWW